MDNKSFAVEVVLWIALAYTLLVIISWKTRHRAKFMECVLVGLLLLIAAIVIPVLFGAVPVG